MKLCQENKFNIFKIFLVIALLSIFIFICASRNKTLEIFFEGSNSCEYDGSEVEIKIKSSNNMDDAILNTTIFRGMARFELDNISNIEEIELYIHNSSETICIRCIELRDGAFTLQKILGEELPENCLQNKTTFYTNNDNLYIKVNNDIGYIKFDKQCISKLNDYSQLSKGIFIAGIFVILIICFIICYKKKEIIQKDSLVILFCGGIFIIFVLVGIVSLFSITYAHPDEDVTRLAIDYYIHKWGLPNFADNEALCTFSNNGATRLSELTPYYFIAGKFGWIFKYIFGFSAYYRMFNFILLCILVLICFKNCRKNKWIFCFFIAVPQVWYIFSYATSDAWDYFLSFIICFELMGTQSLYKRMSNSTNKLKSFFSNIIIGGGLGVLWFGKENYYVVFVIVFLYLLLELFQVEKKKQKNCLKNYIEILSGFICILIFRYGMDLVYYGGRKKQLILTASENSNYLNFVSSGLNFREKGISLKDMLFSKGFIINSFHSFFGKYGWMSYDGDDTYYFIMLILFSIVIAMLIKFFVKTDNIKYKYGYLSIFIFSCILSVSLSVFHSWTGDFQPQGRYLFPCLFGIMPFVSKINFDLSECKGFMILINEYIFVGIYGFIFAGIVNVL